MTTRLPSYIFFFNDTATTEIYTLSLHDALPICRSDASDHAGHVAIADHKHPAIGHHVHMEVVPDGWMLVIRNRDRKSTRLNSSHVRISYAVFCLKKKKYTDTLPVLLRWTAVQLA